MLKLARYLSMVFIVGIPMTLSAEDYYINSTEGTDVVSAGGSVAIPWKTINYAIVRSDLLMDRDPVFHLASGTYDENPDLAGARWTVRRSLTFLGASRSATNITGIFVNGERTSSLILGRLTCAGLSVTPFLDYSLSITDCRVSAYYCKPVGLSRAAVTLDGSSLGSMWHKLGETGGGTLVMTRTKVGAGGVYLYCDNDAGGEKILIDECRFEGAIGNGLSCLFDWVWADLTVKRTTFRHCAGYGVHIDSGWGPSSDVIAKIEDCAFIGCDSGAIRAAANIRYSRDVLQLQGITVFDNATGISSLNWDVQVEDSLISQNRGNALAIQYLYPSRFNRTRRASISRTLIFDNKGAGIRCSDLQEAQVSVDNSWICRNGSGIGGTMRIDAAGLLVESCTIADNLGNAMDVQGKGSGRTNVNHTIFYKNCGRLTFPLGAHTDYCLAGKVLLPGTGNLRGNPKFSNRSLGMYRLTKKSKAIDAGNAAWLTSATDFEGDARSVAFLTAKAVPDIGADEHSLAGVPHHFLAPTVPYGMPTPKLTATKVATRGGSLQARITDLRTGDLVLWILGTSERNVKPGMPLPFELSTVGSPGTLLHVRKNRIFLGARNCAGDALLVVPISKGHRIVGTSWNIQALIFGTEGIGSTGLLRVLIGKKANP